MMILEAVYQTAIWKHFASESKTDQEQCVKDLLAHASPLLELINETFPTYTLHNGQHQLNILTLFEKLLGDRLNDLTALEAAMLILSAFYHDIGMVYKEEERQNLKNDDYFDDFLNANPSARLKLQDQSDELNPELAEWYCRWAHAKRVWTYLNPINDMLVWEGTNFREALAQVCLSHNEAIKYIESDKIDANYWNDGDLKFCAILLRLADILDFDNTRSPESVYSFLGLDSPQSQSAQVSHQEWEKHLASKGFDFEKWSKDAAYPIYFKATPKHPAVENDIREFLDVIESELQNCRNTLRNCTEKWRTFILPGNIDRTYIYSQGYTTGSYKFNLDQKQILNLLMGESLYQNPQVFLRELLQNAIDTSRHREKHEKHVKKTDDFKAQPIELSDWYDEEGFRWIRIDDYGMGMTLDQIQKYFLRVGNSFYNSNEFKISKLDYSGNDKNFTAISKFGIGILSCFMIGDQLEVSTRSVHSDGDSVTPIRLSLQGIDNYYFLFTGSDIPKEMPQKHKNEKGYRKQIGTSISVRIDPNFDNEELKLNQLLDELIYISPIKILEGSKVYGNNNLSDFNKKTKTFSLTNEQKKEMLLFIDDSDIEDFNLEIIRISFDLQDSLVPNVSGIVYGFFINEEVTSKNKIGDSKLPVTISISNSTRSNQPFQIEITKRTGPEFVRHIIPMDISEDLFNNLNSNIYPVKINKTIISHNGIHLPNEPGYFDKSSTKLEFSMFQKNGRRIYYFAILNLIDDLRIDLNIARNKIISIPWNCFSSINFLLNRAIDQRKLDIKKSYQYIDSTKISFNHFEKDFLLTEPNGWLSIIGFNKRNSLNYKSGINSPDYYTVSRNSNLDSVIFKNTLLINFELHIKLLNRAGFLRKKNSNIIKIPTNKVSNYSSTFTCRYLNFNGLMPAQLDNQLYNIDHHFTTWLIKAYDEMQRRFPYYIKAIQGCYSIDRLNKLLEKLKTLLPEELRPDFVITEADFEVDIDALPEWDGNEDDLVVIEE